MRDADAGLGLAPRMESDGLLALTPPPRGVSPPSDVAREKAEGGKLGGAAAAGVCEEAEEAEEALYACDLLSATEVGREGRSLPEGGREEGCEVRLEAGRDEDPEGGREMCRAVVLPDISVAKMRSMSSSVRALSANCILPRSSL